MYIGWSRLGGRLGPSFSQFYSIITAADHEHHIFRAFTTISCIAGWGFGEVTPRGDGGGVISYVHLIVCSTIARSYVRVRLRLRLCVNLTWLS